MKKLFINAVIYGPEKLRADSIAVFDGKIFEIGPSVKMKDLKRRGFEVIDLNGNVVVPGFIDCHLHLLGLGFSLQRVDLSAANTMNKAITLISVAARKLSPGRWLIGRGWDKNIWGGSFPDKTILDKICPDNPVYLYSKDGHALWVNSAALKAAGIDDTTPDPPGGLIKRFSNGEPTGIIFENAIQIFEKVLPPPTEEQKLDAVKRAGKKLNSLGITGAADCDWYAGRLGLFEKAAAKGNLKLRVFVMLSPDDIDSVGQLGLKSGDGHGGITVGNLKLYYDGSLGSQTALMFEPYEGSQDNCGVAALTSEQLEMYYERTHLKGISLAIHAIGDRANAEVLDFFARKQAISKKLGLKHRIEHAQILRKEDISKFKRLDIGASVQPIHIAADRDVADKYWGPRAGNAYPLNHLLKSGATVGFGSDSPVENADPRLGIYAAIARKKHGDNRQTWFPEQSVTVAQAIRCYTEGAAALCRWENKTGVLKVGAAADFTVLSDDPFRLPIDKIPDIDILATIFNGVVAYFDGTLKL